MSRAFVATATADALVSADVTKPAVALPPRWQPNASYLANNATAIAVGAFETTGGSLRYPEIQRFPGEPAAQAVLRALRDEQGR